MGATPGVPAAVDLELLVGDQCAGGVLVLAGQLVVFGHGGYRTQPLAELDDVLPRSEAWHGSFFWGRKPARIPELRDMTMHRLTQSREV